MFEERIAQEIRGLVDRYRAQCLWFLRADYYPETMDDVDRVLRLIEQHGDIGALRRVATLRRWLSPSSNATSAGF